MIGAAGRADAGVFLARLLRLDPAAVVRLRPTRPADGTAELWAMLPFGVLATRRIATGIDTDTTVDAAALLAAVTPATVPGGAGSDLPALRRRDEAWRWPLPSSRGTAVEVLPAADVVRVADAASRTLREAAEHGVGGRAVPERALRDALLDHVPIVVTGTGGERVDVPQRVVQALVRMGFVEMGKSLDIHTSPRGNTGSTGSEPMTLGDNLVTVRLAAGWIGVDASYGSVWYRPTSPLRLG